MILALWAVSAQAQDAPVRLSVPPEMIENGFMQHLLPRFRFRTQINVEPMAEYPPADMAFLVGSGLGAKVFSTSDGTGVFLTLNSNTSNVEQFDRFQQWLESGPGKAAIDGFELDDVSIYSATVVVVKIAPERVIDGDVALGSKLALGHCGRCHVVDKRNRMGGIGSTPSFAAIRGRTGWADIFEAFWTENPHPSFTQVAGVTEPFDPAHPPHIAPVEITVDDIDAILAFVATLEPKDLGQPISGN